MSALVDAARKAFSRGSDIDASAESLIAAVDAAQTRLDPATLDEVRTVAQRAGARLRLSADHTVVALAGATGSGKSSTFNALTGLELAAVGVRRPTTSWATACVWGADGAAEILDWLGIPPRHQTTRDSMLDTRTEGSALDGVVLLDLPDHDSTEVSHHLEVERLVVLADLVVWVLDPQKYADAAIHDRFLKPMASHSAVMVAVLNHIDEVAEDRRDAMIADVRRLLDADGLAEVPVLAISARNGDGVEALRTEIASRAAAKKATRSRVRADLRQIAERLQKESGTAEAPGISADRVASVEAALSEAAGIGTVVEAVHRATKVRVDRATGWPLISWISRLKPDPLKRLHLDLGSAGKELAGTARTSVPEATGVQRALVDSEIRSLASDASEGLTQPWVDAIRRASVSRLDDINDGLDAAVAGTDLGVAKLPVWAGLVRALQWLLIVAAVAGFGWAVAAHFSGTLDDESTAKVGGVSLPLVVGIGAVLAGLVLAGVCRVLVRVTARNRAASAERRLRSAVHQVCEDLVIAPIRVELDAYGVTRAGILAALD
ncbi:MAG: GTPase [Nocardioides sp.]